MTKRLSKYPSDTSYVPGQQVYRNPTTDKSCKIIERFHTRVKVRYLGSKFCAWYYIEDFDRIFTAVE